MITLAEAKAHCRVDHNEDDSDIALKLNLAMRIVEDYTGRPFNASDEPIMDAAVLMIVGELYANREAHANLLSPSVKAILERVRVPAFA